MNAISWLALVAGLIGCAAAIVGMWKERAPWRPQLAMGFILSGAGLVALVVVRLVLL